MSLLNNFKVFEKNIQELIHLIYNFNQNKQLQIDTFKITFSVENSAIIENKITKLKGVKYIFKEHEIEIFVSTKTLLSS